MDMYRSMLKNAVTSGDTAELRAQAADGLAEFDNRMKQMPAHMQQSQRALQAARGQPTPGHGTFRDEMNAVGTLTRYGRSAATSKLPANAMMGQTGLLPIPCLKIFVFAAIRYHV